VSGVNSVGGADVSGIGLGRLGGLGDLGGLGRDPEHPRCSRAGCGSPATRTVNWRNPKIHTADRVKVWLACDDHVEYLRDFLEARAFPVLVAPIGSVVTVVPDRPTV
jgi:hypothetical protein